MTRSPWARRAVVFLVTYLAYMTIHIVRKPSSVLKSVLHPQGSYDEELKPGWAPFNQDLVPSRVAEVGLHVSGAARESENGVYECMTRQGSGNDGQNKGNCTAYRQEGDGVFVIQRKPGSFCRRFVEGGYAGKYCWVLEVLPTSKSWFPTAPLYAQLSEGELPEPIRNGDPHLEDKAWKRFEGPRVYSTFTKLRVRPNIQDGKVLLGLMDTMFLLAYTVGLFVSGWFADRVDIRRFLTLGMVSSGLSSIFLGLGHRFEVHAITYFLVISVWSGLSQSVGWPCVIAVMGRWFPRTYRMRGFIMGAWSSNLYVGNILGSVITTACVSWGMGGEDWPLGFEVPGWIVLVCAVVVFLFLEPEANAADNAVDNVAGMTSSLLPPPGQGIVEDDEDTSPPPSLSRALMIPGVIPFALSLCFAKMGQYALLFWGPYYLQVVGFSSERAGYLCSFFDVGALLGGIAAGWLSDRLKGKRGLTAAIFLLAASASLYTYYGVTSDAGTNVQVNILMMILVGFWVNGPVSLITTAVSQDLGNHPSLNGDERLVASVAGIIDGTGSFGAAMQGILIGVISTNSWERVFQFLVLCCILSASLLGGVVKRELLA